MKLIFFKMIQANFMMNLQIMLKVIKIKNHR